VSSRERPRGAENCIIEGEGGGGRGVCRPDRAPVPELLQIGLGFRD
jgi:hypothetical protein